MKEVMRGAGSAFAVTEDGYLLTNRHVVEKTVAGTLEEVGGTEGIGVNFLEETFSSRTANPKHRLHQQAGREVLKALLPDPTTEIRGHMRSSKELLEASGYRNQPEEFQQSQSVPNF